MATEYGNFTPHAGTLDYAATLFRGLYPANAHAALWPGGTALPTYLTFGVLILSELDPLALMAAFKAHQDYTNPDVSKLLSKNPADRLSTQIQAYYSDLSPLLVAGFHSYIQGSPVTAYAAFKDTVITTIPAAAGTNPATVRAPTASRMGGAHNTLVTGGCAIDFFVPTVSQPIDGRCHRSGVAKSFLVTGHAVAPDGSKLLNAECAAAYASVFAVDLAGTVSGIDGNGDMKVSDANLVAGRTYTFQDMAIAPNCSMLMVE